MKLCSLSLIFILWAGRPAALLNSPSSSPAPRGLALTDAQNLKDAIEKSVQSYHWKAEVVSESKVVVKAKLDGKFVNFFDAEVTPAPEKNGQPSFYLILTNRAKTPGDLSFARFRYNTLYFRQTLSEEEGINETFINRSTGKFKETFGPLLDGSYSQLMFREFSSLIAKEAIQNVVLIERANTGKSIVFDLNHKQSGKLVAQGTIYKVDNERVGLSLNHHDDSTYFVIPVQRMNSTNPEIVRALADMSTKVDQKVTIKEVLEMVKNKIKAACSKSVPTISVLHQSQNSVFLRVEMSGQTLSSTKEDQCLLLDSEIFLSHYTYGFMQYVHFTLNSKVLREEYMSSTQTAKLDANLDKAFQMIKSDLQTAYKGIAANTAEIELKVEDLKKILEEAVGEAPAEEEFTEAEKTECADHGLKCVSKLKFASKNSSARLIINSSGWLIVVSGPQKPSNPPSEMSVSVPLKNSFDSKAGIVQHVKQIMAGL